MKRITSLILLICFIILASACNQVKIVGPGNTEEGGKIPSYKGDPIQMSSHMFENASIELNDTDSIGLVAEGDEPVLESSTIDRTYLVKFREDGTFEKITFVYTTTDKYSDGSYEVKQEQVVPIPINLNVTKKFIFVAYSDGSVRAGDFNDSDYFDRFSSDSENFVIDRATGKLYSLKELGSFKVNSDSSVSVEGGRIGEMNYYYLHVEEDALVVTDLMPNKIIEVHKVTEDGFGNFYIENGYISRKEGNFIYVTSRVFIGDDGYAYWFSNTVRVDLVNFNGKKTYTVKRFDRDGILNERWQPNETVVRFKGENLYGDDGYVAFFNDQMYVVNADGTGEEYCWFGFLTYSTENTYEGEGYLPYLKRVYPLSPSLLLAERGDSKEIWYYDLSSEKSMRGNYGKRFYVESFANQGLLLSNATLYFDKNGVYAKCEDVSGTEIYEFSVQTGTNGQPAVSAHLRQKVEYESNILAIQPLN